MLRAGHGPLKPFVGGLTKRLPLTTSKRLLVLASGGPDSTLLALAAADACRKAECTLSLLHFNHGLREGAREDERFVRRLAEWLGVEVEVQELPVEQRADRSGAGLEGAARELRLSRLLELMQDGEIAADAHHRDDQAETVALQALRGAGALGARGIRRVWEDRLYRPLLDFRKRELTAALEELEVPWRSDPSNQQPRFLRNRVRHGYLKDSPERRERLLDLGERSARLDHLMRGWFTALERLKLAPFPGTPPVRRAVLELHGLEEYETRLIRVTERSLGGTAGLHWWLYLWLRKHGLQRSRTLIEEAAGQLGEGKRFRAGGWELRPAGERFLIGPAVEPPDRPVPLRAWEEQTGLNTGLRSGEPVVGTRAHWRENPALGELYAKKDFQQRVDSGLRDIWPVMLWPERSAVRILGPGEWLSAGGGAGGSLPDVDIGDQ